MSADCDSFGPQASSYSSLISVVGSQKDEWADWEDTGFPNGERGPSVCAKVSRLESPEAFCVEE